MWRPCHGHRLQAGTTVGLRNFGHPGNDPFVVELAIPTTPELELFIRPDRHQPAPSATRRMCLPET